MKANSKTTTPSLSIKIDKSLDKLTAVNLAEKKFEESRALLLKSKLVFK